MTTRESTIDDTQTRYAIPFLVAALAMMGACVSAGGHPSGTVADPRPAPQGEAPAFAAPPPADEPAGQVAPITRSEMTPDRTRREPLPAHVLQARERMEAAYESGLEAYQAGRFDEAKEQFDQAVDVILSSGIDLPEQPALKKAFDDIVRNIADLDADLYTRERDVAGARSGSPLDSLKDIAAFLSPEEAEREREKIQQRIEQVTYDIPIVLNPKVLAFIEAFQTHARKEFEGGLKRSGAYLPLIKRIFREEGLPEDLAYMAHQESAYKNSAYSRARARGMWQFMSFTGRRYGLRRDIWLDERSDFEKATRAATAYLKDLYKRYDDWYLAMAAYNAGEGKIDRAIRRARSKDFWRLTRTRYIRRETKSYVPAILASILIDKSPEDYGFDVDIDPELKWDTVTLDKPTDLQVIADGTGATLKTIRSLNPELRGLLTPPNVTTYTVRVPVGTSGDLEAVLEKLPDDKRVSWTLHRVRGGESFSSIARRHKVPVRAVLDANPRYAKRRRLYRGNILNVPLSGGLPALRKVSAREDRPSYERGERVVHRVRRGDNLHRIARKYRTTVRNLRRWNGIRGSLLRPGQRVVAYYGERGRGPHIQADSRDAAVSVEGGRIVYRVQRRDTLTSIARKFNTGVQDLCRWNRLTSRTIIHPGDRLWVGEPTSVPGGVGPQASNRMAGTNVRHRVRRGDTLYDIARVYSVTVRQLQAWNNLGRRSTIYPGQVLRIGVK